jgi:hypothetical protein
LLMMGILNYIFNVDILLLFPFTCKMKLEVSVIICFKLHSFSVIVGSHFSLLKIFQIPITVIW